MFANIKFTIRLFTSRIISQTLSLEGSDGSNVMFGQWSNVMFGQWSNGKSIIIENIHFISF